jgi:maleate isomerase
MLVPSSNRVVEPELPSMLPEGVAVHTTRLRLVGGGPEELLAMTEKVEEAAELVSHAGVDLTPGNFCCSIKVYGFHVRPREEREEHR